MELRELDYDLGVMHVVYGLAFAFGFQELASVFERLISEWGQSLDIPTALATLALNCAISFVGLRLFWAIGNLRRFVSRQGKTLSSRIQTEMVLVHFPIIILQSFAFYLLCAQVNHSFGLQSGTAVYHRIGYLAATLLFANSMWLLILQRGVPQHMPERLWFGNNLVVGFLILAIHVFTDKNALVEIWTITTLLLLNSVGDLGFTSKWYLRSSTPK